MMRRSAFLVLAGLLYGIGLAHDGLDRWVASTQMPGIIPETSVEVRARDGTLLRAYTVADGRWRLRVSPEAVDPGFVQMLLAYEDKRFWDHRGVDPLALLRAGGQAIWHGEVVSGASTLTMQVARLLEDSGTGAWRGKLRQIRVALALERSLSKHQILGLYLTLAPYGGNLEGLRAASLSYFGKEPRRLTPSERALLVALPQSPERRRPDLAPQAARHARAGVLERALASGILSHEEHASALNAPLAAKRRAFPQIAPHLADRRRGAAPLEPVHDLTIEPAWQRQAERLAARAVRGLASRVSVAMLLADHQTGEILVHVGSSEYSEQSGRQGYVDMTRALRSPGSTLKPLVYGLAFEEGLAHPATVITDKPVAFGGYAPQNFDGVFRGELRVDRALQLSLNIPVVLLTHDLGPARLMAALRAAGMHPRLPGGPAGLAVALGGVGTSLEDLVTLYAGLAQGGKRVDLHAARNAPRAAGAAFVSRSAAWQVGHILSGLAPPPGAAKERMAYKTGTSYGHRDAWAIGFDGRYVAGVWLGRPDGTPVPGAFGGDLAAPVLFELMGLTGEAAVPLSPPPPETLLAETASLPLPLQRFKGRRSAFEAPADAPKLTFPPDGARLAQSENGLAVKLKDGVAPFTWLVDGAPIRIGERRRETTLPVVGPGFVQLSVIDAAGRSARARIRLD